MTDTRWADVSRWQVPVDDAYPHPFFAFKASDGSEVDPNCAANLAWAKANAGGQLVGFAGYHVYRVGEDNLGGAKRALGSPHPLMTIMLDVEDWEGEITTDQSGPLNALREQLIDWLGGSRARVFGYANTGNGNMQTLWPDHGDTKFIIPNYSGTPSHADMIGHQYADDVACAPFGPCCADISYGYTPAQWATALGLDSEGSNNMAYSPDAIRACYDTVAAKTSSAKLGGIYANKPGYHNCRSQCSSSDYSVQKDYDKKGNSSASGALDLTLGDADMKKMTQRLIDACKAGGNSGKLRALREFFGTTNGYDVTGMDVPGCYWVSSDDSHLWHIHMSSKRQYADDHAAWQDVAAVLLGTSGGSTTPPPTSSGGGKPWPSYMPSGHYFGDIEGPEESHGGYYDNEKPDIKAIQQKFITLGYVSGVTDPNGGWADGIWEQPTTDACTKWQKAKYAATTSRYGEVWSDDWSHLFG